MRPAPLSSPLFSLPGTVFPRGGRKAALPAEFES
jgi:hypothetical protein